MMKNLKYFIPPALVLVVLALGVTAYANPFYTGTKARSAAATSTLTYMTAGTGTSTSPVYDSYEVNGTNQTNGGNLTLPNSVALLVQGKASSTATAFNIQCEFADDLTNGGDWYQNEMIASTSNPLAIAQPAAFLLNYASTTVGGVIAVAGANNTFSKLMECPAPLRYVRAVITIPPGALNGGIWASFVPKKQRN